MSTANDPWGRVADDGTVYVRAGGSERVVGSWQAGSPDEALAFYRRKYEGLETEVTLLEQRISTTDLSPGSARATIDRLLEAVATANAVGDLDSLHARLEAPDRPGGQPPRGGQGRPRAGPGRGPDVQGAHRRRGRADRGRGHPLEDQRGADAPAPRGVEGRAAGRPGGGDRAVEAAVGRAERVRQAAQGLFRRAGRRARGSQVRQGEAGRGGRGAGRVHRLGTHRRGVPGPDARLEGGGPGGTHRRGGALGPVQGRPGSVLRRAVQRVLGQGERAARARRGEVRAAGGGRPAGPGDQRAGRPGRAALHPGTLGAGRVGPP